MKPPPDGERLDRLRALLSDALEREPAMRAAFLDDACAGDDALRADIASLLAAHDSNGSVDAVAGALSGLSHRAVGPDDRIGPYRLVRVLGHGGMGAVWLGERADGQFEQRVAIKVIAGAARDPDTRQRFLEERHILARLEHAAIARLLDGGLTANGEPYFAMEYIEGEPIDRHADQRRLDIRARLELFLQVCDAVQFAHQSLIVHRDLKPSNILVTPGGQVKLLDFGIAKLLRENERAPDATRTGLHWLTPAYASPEQIRRQSVSTTSDVYALGVVLYALLTGRLPYHIDDASPAEVEHAVCETEPERPSAVVIGAGAGVADSAAGRSAQPAQLQRRLQGDLDTIVLKAMRKEPEQRYRSAAQLAEDIERHLAGLPVLARPATPGYRAAKFLRRHRAGVTAAFAMFVLLVAGIVGTASQAARAGSEAFTARQERDRAQLETAKAYRVTDFLLQLFGETGNEPARAQQRTAREILDRGATRVEQELSGQPEIQAAVMDVIGRIYHNMGMLDAGQVQLERALALRQSALGNDHLDVAASLHSLALNDLARGSYTRAESLFHREVDVRRRATGGDSAMAVILNDLGLLNQTRGDLDTAERLYAEALIVDRQVLGERHMNVAIRLNNLGSVKRMRGDLDAADSLLRAALDIKLERIGRTDLSTANTLNQLGVTLHARGDLAGADSLYREVLAIRRQVSGDAHPQVANTLNDLALLYRDQGRHAAGDSAAREAVRIAQATLGQRHGYTGWYTGTLASVLHAAGDAAAAEPLYREAADVMRTAFNSTHLEVAAALTGLAVILLERNDAMQAEPLLREAMAIRKAQLPAQDWRLAETESAFGACMSALGRRDEAESILVRAYETLNAGLAAPEFARTRARIFLIAHYERSGQHTMAARYRPPRS
jgi:serine/threonine-protein kinase